MQIAGVLHLWLELKKKKQLTIVAIALKHRRVRIDQDCPEDDVNI